MQRASLPCAAPAAHVAARAVQRSAKPMLQRALPCRAAGTQALLARPRGGRGRATLLVVRAEGAHRAAWRSERCTRSR
jgi:hypothetical protein